LRHCKDVVIRASCEVKIACDLYKVCGDVSSAISGRNGVDGRAAIFRPMAAAIHRIGVRIWLDGPRSSEEICHGLGDLFTSRCHSLRSRASLSLATGDSKYWVLSAPSKSRLDAANVRIAPKSVIGCKAAASRKADISRLRVQLLPRRVAEFENVRAKDAIRGYGPRPPRR
jgi:hypothetical protein